MNSVVSVCSTVDLVLQHKPCVCAGMLALAESVMLQSFLDRISKSSATCALSKQWLSLLIVQNSLIICRHRLSMLSESMHILRIIKNHAYFPFKIAKMHYTAL